MEKESKYQVTKDNGECVTASQAMTDYAYSCGLLNEADASTLLRMAYRKDIGRQIMEARHSSGLTTRQLAEKCGISHSHIVRIESGRYAVTIDTIGTIANALGLQIKLIKKKY